MKHGEAFRLASAGAKAGHQLLLDEGLEGFVPQLVAVGIFTLENLEEATDKSLEQRCGLRPLQVRKVRNALSRLNEQQERSARRASLAVNYQGKSGGAERVGRASGRFGTGVLAMRSCSPLRILPFLFASSQLTHPFLREKKKKRGFATHTACGHRDRASLGGGGAGHGPRGGLFGARQNL